jgi:hypothetical protein
MRTVFCCMITVTRVSCTNKHSRASTDVNSQTKTSNRFGPRRRKKATSELEERKQTGETRNLNHVQHRSNRCTDMIISKRKKQRNRR